MYKPCTKNKGFTLVELMVSVAIFTLVVIAVIGSVYTANASARKVQATQTVLNNMHFALESMVRTIRTGYIVGCADAIALPTDDVSGYPNCSNNNTKDGYIVVHNTLGKDSYIKYYFGGPNDENAIQKQEAVVENGIVQPWSDPVAITAPEVSILYARFLPVGLVATDLAQRGVLVGIGGNVGSGQDTTPFNLQTFVSQRNF